MAESEKLESLASDKEDKSAYSSLSSSIQNPTTGNYDITKCAKCHEPLKEPRSLHCLHIFCLSCLKKYEKDNASKGDIRCPICEEILILGSGGVDSLPIDNFISKLIESTEGTAKRTEEDKVDKATLCEACPHFDTPRQNDAIWFCNQCRRRLCEDCRTKHEFLLEICNGHTVVPVRDEPSSGVLMKRSPCYCKEHRNLITHYCFDCDLSLCAQTCLPEHNHPNIKHIADASKDFTSKIDGLNGQLAKSNKSGMNAVMEQLNKTSADFSQHVQETEISIVDKLTELSKKIKSELEEKKKRHEKHLLALEEDIKHFLQKVKSFESYFSALKRGSCFDIVNNGKRLQMRAQELLAQEWEHDWKSRKEYYTVELREAIRKLIEEADCSGIIDEKTGPLQDAGALLRNAKSVSMVSGGANIHGMTIYGEKLYVVKSKSSIMEEYDLSDLTKSCREIQVKDLNNPRGIVACPNIQCLYISNTKKPNYIYKVNMDKVITSEDRCEVPKEGWDVEDGKPRGLSVSNRHNLLASVRPKDGGLIIEYDKVGRVMRKILVDNISSLQHAIELNETGQLLVCHHEPDYCVTLIDVKVEDSGMIKTSIQKTYGEGAPGGSLKYPHHLTVDQKGNILLSDCWNDKLRVFKPNLEHLGDIKPVGVKIRQPTAFCWDAVRGKLIVGEDRGNIIVIYAGNASEVSAQVCQSD